MPSVDLKVEGKDITIFYSLYEATGKQAQNGERGPEQGQNQRGNHPLAEARDTPSSVTALGQGPPDKPSGTQVSALPQKIRKEGRRSTDHARDPLPRKVLIIAGLGARGRTEFFQHIVSHFAGLEDTQGNNLVSVCTFDTRGIGQSTTPQKLRQYSTRLMALDVAALLDHLQWSRVHIVGLSLGGMIACKLAAMRPELIASLTLIATTLSGWHMLAGVSSQPFLAYIAGSGPLRWKIPANLKYNFTEAYLTEEVDGSRTRMEVLIENTEKAIEEKDSGKFLAEGQSSKGRKGHLAAVFKHRMHQKELKAIREARFPCQVIVGRHDRLARAHFVSRLAKELKSSLLVVEAGHAGILIEAPQAVVPMLETFILGNAQTDILQIAHMRSQTDEQVLQDRLYAKEFLSSFGPGRISFKQSASGKALNPSHGRSKSSAI